MKENYLLSLCSKILALKTKDFPERHSLIGRLSLQRLNTGSSIAESPLSLFVITLVLLAMISMFSLLSGYATLHFAVQAAAREAGASQTRSGALTAMQRVGGQIIGGQLGKYGGITPQDTSGLTLSVLRTQDGGAPQNYNPPIGQPITIDQSRFTYTYVISAVYRLKPILLPMEFPVKAESSCTVEHPEGIGL